MSKRPSPADHRIGELVGIARELALVAGFEAAEILMLHFGGQRRNIPNKMRPSSPFWKVLGKEAALQLARIANKGGESTGSGADVEIPLGSKLLMARRRAAIAGFKGSKNQAAEAFRVSRRTVQRVRNHEPAPMPLFDGLSKRT
jgi:hypothetical protein